MRLLALMLALGCTPQPTTVAECAQLSDATEREQCRYDFVAPLVGDPEALDQALAQIEDPQSRDLLLLRLAIAHPQTARHLCERVSTSGAQEKCQQVLGRPHLGTVRQPPRDAP